MNEIIKNLKIYISRISFKILYEIFGFKKISYRLLFNLILKDKLNQQLSYVDNYRSHSTHLTPIRLLLVLIETNHYQYYQLMAIAKALQIRGLQVKVLICGQTLDGCEIKSVRNENEKDHCWNCRFNEINALPLFELDVIKLNQILSNTDLTKFKNEASFIISDSHMKIIRHGIDITQCIHDSVTRYFYGSLPQDKSQLHKIQEKHINSALMSISAAKEIDNQWTPDIVLSNMSSYTAWEPFYKYFRKYGNRFVQISMTQLNLKSIVFNSFELFPSKLRFFRYLNTRENKQLSEFERKKLFTFLSSRYSGNAEIFIKDNYYLKSTKNNDLLEKLQLKESNRNIFLFSNLYWDIGLSERGGLFNGVIDWVIQTIELLKGRDDCHLYIKPHPAEVFGSAGSLMGISEIIRKQYPNGVANLTIIDPKWKLKPYDFFPLIDIGVIYTGTIGLEMMLAGIPVVSTGTTSHYELGFASEPKTIKEYQEILVGLKNTPQYERNYLEVFAYFYFIRAIMPWNLTKKVFDNQFLGQFEGFNFENLNELLPGKNSQLDHLCKCIIDPMNNIADAWPE